MILDEFTPNNLYEMSNFGPRTTGLPSSIEIWLRTEPIQLPHSNYRVKIDKNKQYSAIFSVGQKPEILKHNHKNMLTSTEINTIKDFIISNVSLIIGHIDGKLDSGEFAIEIQKIRGSK
jgi:hypothetical protein